MTEYDNDPSVLAAGRNAPFHCANRNRTDIHRPSAIDTDAYDFVACDHIKIADLGDVYAARAERAALQAHMARTGATYSMHAHGGVCHVCGNANAIYTMVFWHRDSNKLIRVGQDCAEKMNFGSEAFRRLTILRDGINADRAARAGKRKAEAILAEAGLARAWAIHNGDSVGRQEYTLRDIIGKLVRYGSLSEKQLAFVAKLVDQIDNRAEYEAKQAAAAMAAAPVPACTEERVQVRGKVLSVKQTDFGPRVLVQHAAGYKLWGSLPRALAGVQTGETVEFSAKITPSDRDPKFGFFSRPTKARLVELPAGA